jgi:thioredoxin 1
MKTDELKKWHLSAPISPEAYKMKPPEILSRIEFEKTIHKGIILIDFNAPWCGPCRLQEPILKKIAKKFNGKAVIGEINVDQHPELAASLGIQSIPTIIIFNDQKEFKRFIGLQPENILSSTLNKLIK